MSAKIQCLGFTVEPLGLIPYIGADADTPSWITDSEWYSSRVTIAATGEIQILQRMIFPFQMVRAHKTWRTFKRWNTATNARATRSKESEKTDRMFWVVNWI